MILYKNALESYLKGQIEDYLDKKNEELIKECYLEFHKDFLLNLCEYMKILGLKFRNYTKLPGRYIDPANVPYQVDTNLNMLEGEEGWMIVSKEDDRAFINKHIQSKQEEMSHLEREIEILNEHLNLFVDRDW